MWPWRARRMPARCGSALRVSPPIHRRPVGVKIARQQPPGVGCWSGATVVDPCPIPQSPLLIKRWVGVLAAVGNPSSLTGDWVIVDEVSTGGRIAARHTSATPTSPRRCATKALRPQGGDLVAGDVFGDDAATQADRILNRPINSPLRHHRAYRRGPVTAAVTSPVLIGEKCQQTQGKQLRIRIQISSRSDLHHLLAHIHSAVRVLVHAATAISCDHRGSSSWCRSPSEVSVRHSSMAFLATYSG